MAVKTRSHAFTESLLHRRVLIALTLLLAYGCGFWLWLLHELEGATEPGAPPGLLHWLRDSSLSLPLVALGVFFGSLMAKNLLRKYGREASPLMSAAVVTAVMALYASIALSVGNPIHGTLFDSASGVHGGGHDLPFAVHVVRDGLLALTVDEVLVAVVVGSLLMRRWMQSLQPAAVVQPI
jgi:hypothetical protein